MAMLDLTLFDSESMLDELKEKFTEGSGGEVLYDGDERETILRCMLYLGECLMNEINARANNNLVAFCDETHLIYYGAQQDTYRLEAEAASCTVRFTASSLSPSGVTVPAGSRVTADGKTFFATPEDMVIPPGESVEAVCKATAAGAAGNGYLPGQIDTLANTIPYIERVENTSASGGGSDLQDLEGFREDVLYAPLKFSTTGSIGAYTYKTREVSASIADVAVHAEGADVTVYILCKDGELPSAELLEAALEYLSQKRVKAVTDHVITAAAVRVGYSVDMTYKVSESDYASLSSIQEAVENAVNTYIYETGCKMGTAINPEMLKKAAYSAGAASVEVASPLSYVSLNGWEVPYCEACQISYGGLLGG